MKKVMMGVLVATLTHLGGGLSQAATITVYNTLAAFTAAAGATATEDFSDTTLVSGLSVSPAGGGSISGGVLNDSLAVFGLCVEGGVNCPATTMFSFAPSTTAFGADWDLAPGGAGAGIFFSVHLLGGGLQNVTGITNPAVGTFSGFFGFVSDTPFTSINLGSGFTGNGELFDADNVRFASANASAIPEPSTLVLLGFGLVGAARSRFALRRRQTPVVSD
jgi:hypothetical protein